MKYLASESQTGTLNSGQLTTDRLLLALQEREETQKRVRPPLSVMFANDCFIQNTSATVALFLKPTYKIQAQIKINFNKLQSHICILDTRPGLSIVSKSFLYKGRSTWIRFMSVPNYKA